LPNVAELRELAVAVNSMHDHLQTAYQDEARTADRMSQFAARSARDADRPGGSLVPDNPTWAWTPGSADRAVLEQWRQDRRLVLLTWSEQEGQMSST
jgi:hypothetical protein